MTTSNRFAYVQARLQARHGRRPSDDRWRLLESTPDIASYLQAARATSLRPWIVHLASEADSHQVERSLRVDWGLYVSQIASWMPARWRSAVQWLSTLPYLPHFVYLVRNEPVPRWMLDDPVFSGVSQTDLDSRREALQSTLLSRASFEIDWDVPPVTAWFDAWKDLCPSADESDEAALDRIRVDYEKHTAAIQDNPLAYPVGPPLRRRLAQRFNSIFRQHSGRIPAVFAHLGLMALDVERLRGGLVLRALFPVPAERPLWA
ncbi:MAG: hypothetical protein JSW21_03580 [Gammaproteobacteria bacterium]|nr:MAG: hypothetical protein JSW21_03580 [Gammaproteobacteria bacterium]